MEAGAWYSQTTLPVASSSRQGTGRTPTVEEIAALTDLAHVVLNSNEFVYIN